MVRIYSYLSRIQRNRFSKSAKNNNSKINKMEKEINRETIEVTPIENTPFSVVKRNEEFVITIGNDIVSEKIFNNVEEAEKEIYEKPWNLIWALAVKAVLVMKDQQMPKKNE